MMHLTISRLLELTGGRLLCAADGSAVLTGFSTLEEAGPSDLCFFHNPRYEARFLATRAGAVLAPLEWRGALPSSRACVIGVEDPSLAFERAVELWGEQPEEFVPGAHFSAAVCPSAVFEAAFVSIGPNATVEAGVSIGRGTVIGAGCVLGRGVSVGRDCVLYPNVTVRAGSRLGDRVILHPGAVIGADGFGYESGPGGSRRKVRQAGGAQLDDDVEIGANSTVDRARFGRTRIGAGTKIDNLVQIGHNAVIGRNCLIVAGSAIAGSAVIGDNVTIAGQCGVAGHLRVGDNAVLAARSGVARSLPGGETYMGFPARPAGEERRRMAEARRLPALLLKRVRELEERLARLEGTDGSSRQ